MTLSASIPKHCQSKEYIYHHTPYRYQMSKRIHKAILEAYLIFTHHFDSKQSFSLLRPNFQNHVISPSMSHKYTFYPPQHRQIILKES